MTGAPWHLATLFELVGDAVPERPAVGQGERAATWAEYESAAARLAGGLADHGCGPGSAVGLYLFNGPEYLIANYAALKLRGNAVNVNYRYLDDELHFLLDYAEAEVLIFHTSLGERVARVRDRLPRLRLLVAVDDGGEPVPGAASFDALVAASDPAPRGARSADDPYMLFTGGTTGLPKGVVYHHGRFTENWAARMPRILGEPVPDSPEGYAALARRLADQGRAPLSVPASPVMHGTGLWLGTYVPMAVGGGVRLLVGRHFDAHELWRTVAEHRATSIVIVGDPFAGPMLEALERAAAAGTPYDVSSVSLVYSSGAMFSAAVKDGLLRYLDARLYDGLGSTEGSIGVQVSSRSGPTATARFVPNPGVRVLTEDGVDVSPGSDQAGLLHTPAVMTAYFKDPEKTARTVRMVDGSPYVAAGDWARVDGDGTIVFMGRGSGCINSGGEKVYPEEVEEAVKGYPGVADCLVAGVPDDRFGEVVGAVVSRRPGAGAEIEGPILVAWLHDHLAGYKVPRHLVLVDQVRRLANGKPDYEWTKQVLAAVDDP